MNYNSLSTAYQLLIQLLCLASLLRGSESSQAQGGQ